MPLTPLMLTSCDSGGGITDVLACSGGVRTLSKSSNEWPPLRYMFLQARCAHQMHPCVKPVQVSTMQTSQPGVC